jgi:hypothetical protein
MIKRPLSALTDRLAKRRAVMQSGDSRNSDRKRRKPRHQSLARTPISGAHFHATRNFGLDLTSRNNLGQS